MIKNLVSFDIKSPYKDKNGKLIVCKFKFAKYLSESVRNLINHLKSEGYELMLTDAFRSWATQVALKKHKPKLAANPWNSYHCAGLAMDVDLTGMRIPRAFFVDIARGHGWKGIVSETWHFQHVWKPEIKNLKDAINYCGNYPIQTP